MSAGRSPDSELRRTVLSNGLTVLSEHVPGVRSVAFGAWVRSASLHEARDRMGVSHMLEHMVFKGTEHRSAREIALELEAVGGSLDAYTSREHTVYQARVLDEHLERAADVIGDMVFRPLLRRADLTLERKVILEEISMVDDTPDDLVFELHNEALWGEHPYGYSILGTRETVSSLGVRELRELHDLAYHPSRIVVVAAGSVNHDQLLEVLRRTGWHDVARGDASLPPVPPPIPVAPAVRHVERDSVQTHAVVGTVAPAYGDLRRYPLVLLSVLLGGGMSSRLFQRVREELALAYSVYSYQSFHGDTGMHGVYVATAPATSEAAVEAIREELAAVASGSIPEEEIAMGKAQLTGQVILSLESVTSRMYRAAGVELYGEPYRTLDEVVAVIDSIGAEEVRRAAAEFFAPERQTIVTLGPLS